MSGFCLGCRKQVDVIDPARVYSKHGSRNIIFKGQCPTCGHDIYRIGQGLMPAAEVNDGE